MRLDKLLDIKLIEEEISLKPKFNDLDLCDDFYKSPGNQHYKLLAYLSSLFNNVHIIEIGTHLGESSVALSYNESNTIYTFDIIDKVSQEKKQIDNIKFIIDDIMTDYETREKWKDTILSSAFIFLDVDPHNGTMEYDFYLFLKENNYSGFVVCDDIWYFKEMRDNFWYKIPYDYRYDISHLGHWSGTGILSFNNDIKLYKNDNSDWTLVTGYFNLTKCPDASEEICKRDKMYYFSHSLSTLSLPYNLIVYCDNESYDEIVKLRPAYLADKTKYVIIEFDDIVMKNNIIYGNKSFSYYRDVINRNRKEKVYSFDNRNTASYYLFCMSRYIMLTETIEKNPFNSKYFGWINFCIERMGYTNLKYLDEALSVRREKFSTCYIDYVPYDLIQDTKEYYKFGRCSMCSGFFTGNKEYMYNVCNLILDKFLYYLSIGYGHADEQLYSPVYFENPDLFEHYYGDYQQMITNYKYIYEAAEAPIYNFVNNSFKHKNFNKCIECCEFILNSLNSNKCQINNYYMNLLMEKYLLSKINTKFYLMFVETEIQYFYTTIIKPYLNKGCNQECFTNCQFIIDFIIKNNIEPPMDIYFLIYFSYYVSSFYVNRDESENIIDNIFTLIGENEIFKNEYIKNKGFYDNQFKFVNRKFRLEVISTVSQVKGIPIIIICHNNYKYVNNTIKLIENVNANYLENIIILDNNSSCDNTKKYLKESEHKIIFNNENNGPWINENINNTVYNSLPNKFILTDPDLQFNKNLPTNFIEIMQTLSDKYLCEKIGFALDISDFDQMHQFMYVDNKTIYDHEIKFYQEKLNDDNYELYKSPIDTTFCMVNKKGTYDNTIRIAGNFTAKHIPWYIKNEIYNDYELYKLYKNSQHNISTFAKCFISYFENMQKET